MRFWHFRRQRETDLQDELQAHLAMAVRDRIERGEDPQAAEAAARREFGNLLLVQETTRDAWGTHLFSDFLQDLRYSLRSIRKSPGVTAVIVASLALGIGANLSLFSLVYTVLLRSLPVSHPEQLVELLQHYPGDPRLNGGWSVRSFEHYQAHNHVFSAVTGMGIDNVANMQIEGGDGAVLVAEFIAGNYFSELGLQPALGRLIQPEDIPLAPGAPAVVSWNLWQSRLHGDPHILGRHISVNGAPAIIAGVAPRNYTGLRVNAQTDVWLPRRPDTPLNLIARLKPGVPFEQARAEMTQLFQFTIDERSARSTDPLVRKLRFEMEPARTGLSNVRDRMGQPLAILMSIVGILLLLACVNVAGILLVRGVGRSRELALRISLGASRSRLMRQVLTDSCVLSLAGGAIGAVLAYFATSTLLRTLDSGRPHERVQLQIPVDASLIAFASGIALFTGVLFGIVPAWHAFRAVPFAALRSSGRASETRLQRWFANGLVAAQVALAMFLLSAGSLFIANLRDLDTANLGFRRDHVLLLTPDPSASGLRGERLANLYQELLGKLQSLPGVQSASLSAPTPLMGAGASGFATAEGFEERFEDKRRITIAWAGPAYFETLMTPLYQGRSFTFQDRSNAAMAIINQAAARYYFANRNPIGQHITLDHVTGSRDVATYQIIGVAGDTHYFEIRETPNRRIYLPIFYRDRVVAGTFLLRTTARPQSVAAAVRQTFREVAPSLAIRNVTTLDDQIDSSIVPERRLATLSGFFAALGAILAAIGLYGLLAYTVARRTSEIGIRLALGATARDILQLVSLEAVAIVAAGLAVGIPLALWSRHLAAGVLPEKMIPSGAPLAAAASLTLALAIAASYLPASRATHVDPVEALRQE